VKKSVWRHGYYKSASIANFGGNKEQAPMKSSHPAATKMRAKLRRLAHKHSTASANGINKAALENNPTRFGASRINGVRKVGYYKVVSDKQNETETNIASHNGVTNKPDYHNSSGSRVTRINIYNNTTQSGSDNSKPEPKSLAMYWKSLEPKDEVLGNYSEPVSDVQNETETKVASLNNVTTTYWETVHNEKSASSDGQKSPVSASEVTEPSIIRTTSHDAETESGNSSETGKNKLEVNSTRKRRFDIASNEIPTFSHPGEPPPLTGNGYGPEVEFYQNPNRLDGTGLDGQDGRRVSQNERYSKVGRDPPVWAPVEPLEVGQLPEVGPFLREPVDKRTTHEEPYEPIPPLAEKDRKWKSSWKPELDVVPPKVTLSVNRTGSKNLGRRRPEAKEGGPRGPALGKIASPLEREWIEKAEIAAATNKTESTSGVQPNGSVTQKIRNLPSGNWTAGKLRPEDNHKIRSSEDKLPANNDQKDDCATSASWKNVQLIQDVISGGYYVIQAKIRSNCSQEEQNNPDSLEKRQQNLIGRNRDEKGNLANQALGKSGGVEESPQTFGKILPQGVNQAGWMDFGRKSHQDSAHPSKLPKDGSDLSSATNDDQERSSFQPIIPSETFPDIADDVLRYYVVGKRPQIESR